VLIRSSIALVVGAFLATLALLTTLDQADAQAPEGRFVVETVFDSTVPVPPPGDISYFIFQFPNNSPAPVVISTRSEFAITGDFFFNARATPEDLAWRFEELACTRDGVAEAPIAFGARVPGAPSLDLTVAAGEELICAATFGWDPPARTVTFGAEIVGIPPSETDYAKATSDSLVRLLAGRWLAVSARNPACSSTTGQASSSASSTSRFLPAHSSFKHR